MNFVKTNPGKNYRSNQRGGVFGKKVILRIFLGALLTALGATLLVSAAGRPKGFVVIIDPGHGGTGIGPKQVHGDKYDPILKKYLIYYQQGTSYGEAHESEIVFDMARRIKGYLDLTKTAEGRKEFEKLLQEYVPGAPAPSEPIHVSLSKPEGLIKKGGRRDFSKPIDYNSPYREYDFPNKESGERELGVISRINKAQPHLVVSLHINAGYGSKAGAMSAVASPGYDAYRQAVDYVKGGKAERAKIARDFDASPYRYWFSPNGSRTNFQWYLSDSWVYFTGYWSSVDGLKADPKKYQGRRYNYFTWAYEDEIWEAPPAAAQKLPDLRELELSGPFWEREQGEAERWRREGGPEGIGGDNLYAGNELLRYVRLGLLNDGVDTAASLPVLRRPTLSPWTMPNHINAISAYLELGFLDNPNDFRRLTKFPDTYARSIAVGIYSLLYGLEPRPDKPEPRNAPKGSAVDFSRYENRPEGNYFLQAVD